MITWRINVISPSHSQRQGEAVIQAGHCLISNLTTSQTPTPKATTSQGKAHHIIVTTSVSQIKYPNPNLRHGA